MKTTIPHVLVVDDNHAILESVAMVLRWNALRVTTLAESDNFTQEVQGLNPDLIVLDKSLGWADGCDLCTGLKKNLSMQDIKIIMFSAYHNVHQECLAAGADAFLLKPFDLNDMLGLVKRLTKQALLPS